MGTQHRCAHKVIRGLWARSDTFQCHTMCRCRKEGYFSH